jgi:hypothetical protein
MKLLRDGADWLLRQAGSLSAQPEGLRHENDTPPRSPWRQSNTLRRRTRLRWRRRGGAASR